MSNQDAIGERVEEEDLYNTDDEVLDRLIPVAEESGMTLGVHHSDPPVAELCGIPF